MFFVFGKLAPAPGDKKAKAVCLRLFRFISTRPAALPIPSPERGRVNGPVSSVGLSTEILPLETLGGVVRVELVSGVCLIPADNVVVFFLVWGFSFFVFRGGVHAFVDDRDRTDSYDDDSVLNLTREKQGASPAAAVKSSSCCSCL